MKRVLLTIMKVYLEFDSAEEREAYIERNKHRGWSFVDEYGHNNGYILVVERPYINNIGR